MAPTASAWAAHVELAHEAAQEPEEAPGPLCLKALPDSICQLRLNRGVPECVRKAAKGGEFCIVVQEPGAATAWVPRRVLGKSAELARNEGAEEVDKGCNWCVLQVSGNGQQLAGAAASLCSALLKASVRAQLLTAFGMEAILVPEASLPATAATLVSCGHGLWPVFAVTLPMPWEATKAPASDPALSGRLAGVWSLVHREQPLGAIIEEFTEGDGPLRLQAPSGLFVETRIPESESGKGEEASFAGRWHAEQDGSQVRCTQLRALDFQPPCLEAPRFQVTLSDASVEVVGREPKEYRELWARVGPPGQDVVSLELVQEADPKLPDSTSSRYGVWIFVGKRYSRILGPPRGQGLVAGTCCESLGRLRQFRGSSEVTRELHDRYEAQFGIVEEPGLLRTRKMSFQPERSDTVFFNANDSSTGKVTVGKETIVVTRPSGHRETWRIVDWAFDPFSAPARKEVSPVKSPGTSIAPESDDAGAKSAEEEVEEEVEEPAEEAEEPAEEVEEPAEEVEMRERPAKDDEDDGADDDREDADIEIASPEAARKPAKKSKSDKPEKTKSKAKLKGRSEAEKPPKTKKKRKRVPANEESGDVEHEPEPVEEESEVRVKKTKKPKDEKHEQEPLEEESEVRVKKTKKPKDESKEQIKTKVKEKRKTKDRDPDDMKQRKEKKAKKDRKEPKEKKLKKSKPSRAEPEEEDEEEEPELPPDESEEPAEPPEEPDDEERDVDGGCSESPAPEPEPLKRKNGKAKPKYSDDEQSLSRTRKKKKVAKEVKVPKEKEVRDRPRATLTASKQRKKTPSPPPRRKKTPSPPPRRKKTPSPRRSGSEPKRRPRSPSLENIRKKQKSKRA